MAVSKMHCFFCPKPSKHVPKAHNCGVRLSRLSQLPHERRRQQWQSKPVGRAARHWTAQSQRCSGSKISWTRQRNGFHHRCKYKSKTAIFGVCIYSSWKSISRWNTKYCWKNLSKSRSLKAQFGNMWKRNKINWRSKRFVRGWPKGWKKNFCESTDSIPKKVLPIRFLIYWLFIDFCHFVWKINSFTYWNMIIYY